MKKTLFFLLGVMLVITMLLTACGGGGNTPTQPGTDDVSSGPSVSDVDSVPSGAGENNSDDYIDETDSSTTSGGGASLPKPNGNSTTTTKGGGNSQQPAGKYDPYAGITKDMSGKTVRILICNGAGEDDTAAGDAFKKKYGIRYRFLGVPLPMYKTKLVAMVASKDAPDLAVMTVAGTGDFPAMVLNGAVQPLPEGVFDVERDTELDKFQMEWTSWGGKYYGVQLKNSTEYQRGVIVYNKSLFQERGVTTPYELWKKGQWNRDTFAETMKKMTYTQGTEKIYGFAASDVMSSLLSAAETDFVKKDKNDKFINNVTDGKLISIMQWAADLREKGYWYGDSNGASGLFQSGKAAMWGEMSWVMAKLTGVYDKVPNAEVVPVPSGKGDKVVQPIDASVWCVPTGAQNPKEACYFARYWLDANNVDLNAYYPNKQFVEMHKAMSYAENRFSQVSAGVCGYDDITKHSELHYAFSLTPNDIPVFLKGKSSMIDGLISRINGMKAPNVK